MYQFWQKDKKDEVNASERKIGGADLGPVTQLFTENYMVRFLLENSLGAWWAARHPDSPLVKGFEYLRFDDDGKPAAGSFDGWPDRVAEVTVMDPCCGSGHFLVEAFSMLWQMRAEEEGLAPVDAQDAVLRDNLFGLELDPRCVQIAMFAVALQAWKAGGGWRQLPVPNIACSGIPVKAPVEEWKALAGGDERLENALVRLHILFRDADTLGSLIDPKRATEVTRPDRAAGIARGRRLGRGRAASRARPLDEKSSTRRSRVLGSRRCRASREPPTCLSRRYTLVVTNVPYLSGAAAVEPLRESLDSVTSRLRKADLATHLLRALRALLHAWRLVATVTPQNWLFLAVVQQLSREWLLQDSALAMSSLGSAPVRSERLQARSCKSALLIVDERRRPSARHLHASTCPIGDGPRRKARELMRNTQSRVARDRPACSNPDRASILAETVDRIHAARRVCDVLAGHDRPATSRGSYGTSGSVAIWATTGVLPADRRPATARTAGGSTSFCWENGSGRTRASSSESDARRCASRGERRVGQARVSCQPDERLARYAVHAASCSTTTSP